MIDEKIIRTTVFSDEFDDYLSNLKSNIRSKYDYVIHIIETQYVVSEKFIKKLQNSDFYEMRVSVSTNEYRTIIFAVNNESFIESTEVILLNSFLKKSEKDYKKAISKAEKILTEMIGDYSDE